MPGQPLLAGLALASEHPVPYKFASGFNTVRPTNNYRLNHRLGAAKFNFDKKFSGVIQFTISLSFQKTSKAPCKMKDTDTRCTGFECSQCPYFFPGLLKERFDLAPQARTISVAVFLDWILQRAEPYSELRQRRQRYGCRLCRRLRQQ